MLLSALRVAIRLCLTAHAIFSPKFWNDKMNFTRVFVNVLLRRPWHRGWLRSSLLQAGETTAGSSRQLMRLVEGESDDLANNEDKLIK